MKNWIHVNHLLKYLSISLALLSLNGCFLISDIDVIEKGEEVSLSDGNYSISAFDFTKSMEVSQTADFSKFSTKIEEPEIRAISEVKEGNFLSRSYVYQSDDSEIKFEKLDHVNFKNIYLAQIAGTMGMDKKAETKIKDSPKYTFMFAKISEQGDLSFFTMLNEKDKFSDFINSKQVSLTTPKEYEEMDFGARIIAGDDKEVREAVIKFASTTNPDFSIPLIEFKKMCIGEIESWNECIGKTEEEIEPEGTSVKYSEVKVGPYMNGKASGTFFRKRKMQDGSVINMAGNYSNGEQDGFWLYKGDGWRRVLKFNSGKATDIKLKTEGLYYEGSLYETDTPKKSGSLKFGFVETDDRRLEGNFSEVDRGYGMLTKGEFEFKGVSAFLGTYKDGYKLEGQDVYENGLIYTGTFDKENGLNLGSIQNSECENIGRFESQNLRDGTTNHANVEGKTICGSGNNQTIKIGTASSLCEGGSWGGPIYFENSNIKFWGTTSADCKVYEKGIMVEKASGKAFAVKAGKSDFIKLKEVNMADIMREHALQ